MLAAYDVCVDERGESLLLALDGVMTKMIQGLGALLA